MWHKPAILSLILPHSNNYVNPDYIDMDFDELMNACDNFPITVIEEMSHSVEEATRSQSCGINIEVVGLLHHV